MRSHRMRTIAPPRFASAIVKRPSERATIATSAAGAIMADSANARFTEAHLETWRRDGAVLIESFFTPEEVAAVVADFAAVFGRTAGAGEALTKRKPGEAGKFNPAQFKDIEPVPIDCSPALNLIGAHPALMAFAKAALNA